VPAPEDEAGDDDDEEDGEGPGGESLFDLMIAMAEADLKLDKTSEIEDYVPERKMSENDVRFWRPRERAMVTSICRVTGPSRNLLT
jgi:hypothetical protein